MTARALLPWVLSAGLLATCVDATAQNVQPTTATDSTSEAIDLPGTLARAGGDSLEIALAREAVAEADAQDLQATMRLFPYLSLGGQYVDHTGGVPNVNGVIIDADKRLTTLNGAVVAQIDLGDAVGKKQVATERRNAASAKLKAQRATTLRNAAWAYFDLVGAAADVGILQQAVATSRDYLDQLGRAADLGLAARSEVLRVEVELQSNQIALRQAQERSLRASGALAEILHLPADRSLAPTDRAPIPIRLSPETLTLEDMLAKAFSVRPEVAQSRSEIAAAELAKKYAVYGPLLPTVTAQYGRSRLRGGPSGAPTLENDATDTQLLLTWRIGPGGLFDKGRIDEAGSRARQATLQDARLHDSIAREVVESREALRSAEDQMALARSNVENAEKSLTLAKQRREFGIAAVLETIAAQQQLVAAQRTASQAVTQHNRAQYALARAVGLVN